MFVAYGGTVVAGGPVSRYAAGAGVLRLLAAAEPMVLDGNTEPLRSVLRIGAEACERLDEANQKCARALLRAAELERLLGRTAAALESIPMPMDGGSWVVFELATEIRRALARADQIHEPR